MPTAPRCPDRTVALPVLAPKVRTSRVSWWRAGVLILVNAAIGAHLLQWWLSGRGDGVRRTLAPVEPSEAMYTIQNGQVNPGVIFFAAAILSTLLLGRWVCGWGCHIIALQDLCTWLLGKVGVRPRPFRTRLVLWGTAVMAFYMFAWPAVHRWVLTPWLGESLPLYFGRSAPWPGLEAHFLIEDLWATMPTIAVAVPFILVTTFVVVYFLGSKGYCTYGCPYGALFAPADRLSPLRIVVNDRCEGCGHCTAVCTSNVRVHEEVRDYGMVVDPGCMKCMDCVSVCPNDALSFGVGRPALLARPRDAAAAARRADHPRGAPRYDLSLAQEAGLFLVWVAVLFGIRGTMGWVPLLFASGLAALATWGVATLWKLARDPNVRAGHVQLKLKGRWRPAAAALALATLALLGASAWSAYVRMYLRDTAAVDHYRMMASLGPAAGALSDPATVVPPGTAALAAQVRDKLVRSDAPAHGGIGWALNPADLVRLAQAQLALRDWAGTEATCARVLALETVQNMQLTMDLLGVMKARGATPEDMLRRVEGLIEAHPEPGAACLAKATLLAGMGRVEDSRAWIRKAFTSGPATDPAVQVEACRILVFAGEPAEAEQRIQAAIQARPWSPELLVGRALLRLLQNDGSRGEADLRAALELDPSNTRALELLAQVLEAGDRPAEASRVRERLQRALHQGPTQERQAPNAN